MENKKILTICYKETLDRDFHALGDGARRQIVASLSINRMLSASELNPLGHNQWGQS